MTFGIDIGTTSVAGVAVDAAGKVCASVTRAHGADLPKASPGVDEQDPDKLFAAAQGVIESLTADVGQPNRIGWTGQMHGVVAVDEGLSPLTPFVTWRDARRYGGVVMAQWHREHREGLSPKARGLSPFKCLTAPGYVIAKMTGKCVIDPTFLEAWNIAEGTVPASWLPEVVERSMLGDNQAGVYAAQVLLPGCAVVNLGTSGQLSVVCEGVCPQQVRGVCPQDKGVCPQCLKVESVEIRRFVDGKSLLCRASLVGGQSLAALRERLGISWEELNARAGTDPEVKACVDGIVEDLVGDIDLSGVTGLVGVGNALVRNPCLREAIERRFERPCVIPEISEMAAYGAALMQMDSINK